MPKRINDDPGDEQTGMDQGDTSGAAEAGRVAYDEDVLGGDVRDPHDDSAFDPTSRDRETGEVL